MKSKKAFIIIPTYNEKDNIKKLVKSVLNLRIPDVEQGVIIVDDNSPDGTGAAVANLKLKMKNLKLFLLRRPKKLGLGTAYIAGFKKALSDGADFVITMDADFSHNPKDIPKLIKEIDGYDLVFGSRYVKGGGITGWTLDRHILSRLGNFGAKVLLGLKIKDCTTGFRCYKKEVLKKIDFANIKSDGYSYLVEMAFLAQKSGFKIGEVPIVFQNRILGASKISRKEIFKAIQTVLRLGLKRIKR